MYTFFIDPASLDLCFLGSNSSDYTRGEKHGQSKQKKEKKCNHKNRMHIIMYTHIQVFVYPINLLFSWNNHTHKMIFALQIHESTVYSCNERVSNCPVHVHTVPVVASAWFCCGKTPGLPVCSSLGSGQVLYS